MSILARNRNYRLFFTAAAVSNLGDGIALLAFPWLTTLITRDAALIALVAAMTRLPWLVFSLPAGVITDQYDRRRLIVYSDVTRMFLTTSVVGLVLLLPSLPLPENSVSVPAVVAALCVAAFLIGTAEVLRDNAAQTTMPSIVEKNELEQANGQLWSIEQIMGQFIGPPLAGILIAIAVPAPFFFNACAFGLAAWFLWQLSLTPRPSATLPAGFQLQLREGIDWIRGNALILRLAFMLGCLNFATMMSVTILVLLSQEVFGLTAYGHGFLLTAGAAGGVLGGVLGPRIVAALGAQRTILITLFSFPIPFLILAITSSPYIAGIALFTEMFMGMTWNIVTVSLRQRIIPDRVLGRVNSIYRFFGWGTIPLGAMFAGTMVSVLEGEMLRTDALRAPYWLGCLVTLSLAVYGAKRLKLPMSF